ncbi:unnamed protein product [Vitrella brassicaformis CCMP3155]|uniref:Uncharacterized protein n=2 Tax=Vitrella brassicaformis TaxID=1169539 RepID=A0A0G4GCE1_VITBC|nr:unnamed protein product [Vitrella brassicaformis CCMP3155]|eukprot:CEM26973.1 unnamed protein product [Vitrella brassicaformis CCMP3155]
MFTKAGPCIVTDAPSHLAMRKTRAPHVATTAPNVSDKASTFVSIMLRGRGGFRGRGRGGHGTKLASSALIRQCVRQGRDTDSTIELLPKLHHTLTDLKSQRDGMSAEDFKDAALQEIKAKVAEERWDLPLVEPVKAESESETRGENETYEGGADSSELATVTKILAALQNEIGDWPTEQLKDSFGSIEQHLKTGVYDEESDFFCSAFKDASVLIQAAYKAHPSVLLKDRVVELDAGEEKILNLSTAMKSAASDDAEQELLWMKRIDAVTDYLDILHNSAVTFCAGVKSGPLGSFENGQKEIINASQGLVDLYGFAAG